MKPAIVRHAWILALAAVVTALGAHFLSEAAATRDRAAARTELRLVAMQALDRAITGLGAFQADAARMAADRTLQRDLQRFEATGDFRARLRLEERLDDLASGLDHVERVTLADSEGRSIASTRSDDVGTQAWTMDELRDLAAARDQARVHDVDSRGIAASAALRSGSRITGFLTLRLNNRLFGDLPAVTGALRSETPWQALLWQPGAEGDNILLTRSRGPLGAPARTDLEALPAGERAALVEVLNGRDGSAWLTEARHIPGSMLTAIAARPEAVILQPSLQIRRNGMFAAGALAVAWIVLFVFGRLLPYLGSLRLLRRVTPELAPAENAPPAVVPGDAQERRSESEHLAYDILSTHHVLQEVMKEHTQELEKLYRTLHQEHSRRDLAEGRLRESEERFHIAVNGALEGVWDWDGGDRWEIWLGDHFYQALGLRREDFPGKPRDFLAAAHPDDLRSVQDGLHSQLRYGNRFEVEFRLRQRNGEYRWFASRGEVIKDDQGRVSRTMGSLQDIQARKGAEAEVERLLSELADRAERDSLTRLLNRQCFTERMQGELGRAALDRTSLSVVLFDVDQFRRINDIQGHAAGDAVLCRIASALRGATRETHLVCRYGADEFLVALPDTSPGDAAVFAETVCAELAERPARNADGVPLPAHLRAGVACWDGREALPQLIRRAELARLADPRAMDRVRPLPGSGARPFPVPRG